MAKTIELAIWDYDGVIVDSFRNVHAAYVRICSELAGKYFQNIDEFRREYNSHKNHLEFLESIGIGRELHARADEIFKEELAKVKEPLFFEGIEEVLRKVYDARTMVIVSSAHRSEIIPRLSSANLLHLFMDISACEENGRYHHKSEPIRQIIQKHAKSPDSAVMIGDRTQDFTQSLEAGIPPGNVILVDYGWGYDERKIRAEGYCLKTRVKTPFEIIPAITEIETR